VRAMALVKPLALVTLALLTLMVVLAVFALPFATGNIAAWIFIALTAMLPLLSLRLTAQGKRMMAFLASAASLFTLWLTAALIQYPVLLRADDGVSHLTIRNASSSQLTLQAMLIVALVGMPFVITYIIYVYRVFSRKMVNQQD